MHFDLIYSQLQSLHSQTALLEACDWDEEMLSAVISEVDEYLRFLNPGYFNSWKDMETDISNHLTNKFNNRVSDIIINTINSNRKEFKDLMELPEQ
tara:strand:- start:499 stop:786 length:288 start_codon:yes stop_codon:yes gene_type:complete